MSDRFHWARLLAFVTGLVNQELLLRNEYLAAENRILRAHLPSRLRLSHAERSTLAEIAKRLGRYRARCQAGHHPRLVSTLGGPEGSRHRAYPGRPRVPAEGEALVVRFARENGVPVVLERKLALRSNDLFYEGVATSTRLNFPLRNRIFATLVSA